MPAHERESTLEMANREDAIDEFDENRGDTDNSNNKNQISDTNTNSDQLRGSIIQNAIPGHDEPDELAELEEQCDKWETTGWGAYIIKCGICKKIRYVDFRARLEAETASLSCPLIGARCTERPDNKKPRA